MNNYIILIVCIIISMNYSCGSDNNKSKVQIQTNAKDEEKTSSETESINSNRIIHPTDYNISVTKTYNHPKKGFTQGLVFYKGSLYEGTGLVGQTYIRKIDLSASKIIKERKIEGNHFGEGIAILNNKIYELTWTSNTCLLWDLESFNLITSFSYPGEGWGLTTDGNVLYMSDGTDVIRIISPKEFKLVNTINITDEGNSIDKINELEYIDGKIWANIWMEDKIIIIDPSTGQVTGRVNLQSLRKYLEPYDDVDVLNGIAYNSETKKIYLTGKKWPLIFEVKIIE
jgi:glutaminyl-peptide cyclotransferase